MNEDKQVNYLQMLTQELNNELAKLKKDARFLAQKSRPNDIILEPDGWAEWHETVNRILEATKED